jgi:hypothetical protein
MYDGARRQGSNRPIFLLIYIFEENQPSNNKSIIVFPKIIND